MMTGNILRKERRKELRLERKTLGRRDLIILKRDLCNGCGTCAEVCPKNSISIEPASIENGRLRRFPTINIDTESCIMCGICTVFCPLNALESWVDEKNKNGIIQKNEKIAMCIQNEAIPRLIRKISIDQEICRTNCELNCKESCPRNVIEVIVQKEDIRVLSSATSDILKWKKIADVQLNTGLCIYCKSCEYACPHGAISVDKIFEGSVAANTNKCPPNCQVCMDICPSNAIELTNKGKITVSQKNCIFCKACQNVCPENIINVSITRITHEPITSATWITLLENFVSYKATSKELAAKSRKKLRTLIESRNQ
jgi:4Fe-4S ferredoxin